MSAANQFGQIVSPLQVEQAVVALLNDYMDTYLGEAERLFGYQPGQLQRPKGIVNGSEWEKWPEDQIPVILVINTGMAGPPERYANGRYNAAWMVGISPICSDVDQAATRTMALAYVTAVRAAMLQHKRLKSTAFPNGFASYTAWHDESYTDVPFLSSRSLMAGRIVLEIGVEGVLTEQAGPRAPLTNPSVDPGQWPTVSTPPATTVIPRSPLEAVTT